MLIIGIILGGILVVFMLQNVIPVTVFFLGWQFEGNLAFVVLVAIVAGMIVSWLFSIPEMIRLSGLTKYNKKLEKDLEIHKQKLSETEGKLSQAEAPVVLETKETIVVEKKV